MQTLLINTTGNYNTAEGYRALYSNTGGIQNTAIGANAGYNLADTTGLVGNNTLIGYRSGLGITTGGNNTIIGANVTGLASGLSNNIIIADGSGNQRINIDATGNVGIGTSAPAVKLTVVGDIRVGTTGTNGCIQGFGGATIAGTCSSDERLKTNILSVGNVLDRFLGVDVVNYQWNQTAADLYKNDTTATQIGYRAQNIESLFPELVSMNSDGYKQVNYSAMNLYAVKAIKELALANNTTSGSLSALPDSLATQSLALSQMQSLVSSLSANSGSTSLVSSTTVINNYTGTGFIMSGTGQIATDALTAVQAETPRSALSYITDMFAHAFEVVRDFVALQITAVRGYFDQIFAHSITTQDLHTERLCIKKSNGSEICLTGDQVESMMGSSSTPPVSSPPPSPSSVSGAPSNPSATADLQPAVPPSNTPILGCIDNTATNYSSTATQDDGSCIVPVVVSPVTPPEPATGAGI
jgi:Chaperone of endosialidase